MVAYLNKILTVVFLLASFSFLQSQDVRLANQYFANGEYEKAGTIYNELHKKNKGTLYYFSKYLDCLVNLEEYDLAKDLIKKQLKKNPKSIELYVTRGNIYEQQFDEAAADKEYKRAIQLLSGNINQISQLANSFTKLAKFDLAIATFERGNEILKNKTHFAYNLAGLYQRKGDTQKMIEFYLLSMGTDKNRLNNLKSIFQRTFDEAQYDDLQTKLYEKIQEYPEVLSYPELLQWVFIQKKDYKGAFRQARALDRQLEENGSRVYNLAQIALNDKDYDTAIEAFEYIVSAKGRSSSYFLISKKALLASKRKRLVAAYEYSQEDLNSLRDEYRSFLDEFGRNKESASIMVELAELHAFYYDDLARSIEILNKVIKYPNLDKYVKANAKLDLADYYLMSEDIWEATLLYSQVDKEFKEDYLGEIARFKNAKLSYYNGDFEWAQAQFDILKASTSKLISNDAIDLSVFIMDNVGLDTTYVPLEMYSAADLLHFQNKFMKARAKLKTITEVFPEHSLHDDIYYLEGQIFEKERNYEAAKQSYEKIIELFPEEIRADNALYRLAELHQLVFKDLEKAQSLYEKLFLEYSSSTFAIESRKRFRTLRGDFDKDNSDSDIIY